MKWLVLSDHPWERGGLQSRTIQLCLALFERGHGVDFMCYGKDPYSGLAADHPGQVKIHEPVELNTRSIGPRDVFRARRALRDIAPDAIFFCNTPMPNFAPFVFSAPSAGVENVVVHHGTEIKFVGGDGDGGNSRRLIPRPNLWRARMIGSARLAARNVNLALFNNDVQMDSWRKELRYRQESCTLWYPPVDVASFRHDPSKRRLIRQELGLGDGLVIGGVGRLCKQKSFDVAIRALARCKHTLPEAVLAIAGQGEEQDALERLAAECGIADRVMLLGERSDVPSLMSAFDIFCLPSTDPNESLGIVILEAMAASVPVVVTDLPGPRRLAQDGACGIVVPAGDDEQLAKAFLDLGNDRTLRESYVQKSDQVVQQASRDAVVENLLQQISLPASVQ